jgi:hypothetical protein
VVLQVVTTPGYFDAIGMTFLAGRSFDEHDNVIRVGPDGSTAAKGPLVAIVSQTFARGIGRCRMPFGKRIRHGEKAAWITVMGVIKDEKHYGSTRQWAPPSISLWRSQISDHEHRAARLDRSANANRPGARRASPARSEHSHVRRAQHD